MTINIGWISTRVSPILVCVMVASSLGRDPAVVLTPESASQAVADLKLPATQEADATLIVDRYRQMQKQAHDTLLQQMSKTLTAEQFQSFKRSLFDEAVSVNVAEPTVSTDGETRVLVNITGGHDTDPRDHGRPVVLVAAALDVPDEMFRRAFSSVHPAGPGQQPREADVQRNKQVLLDALGVDNDRLDEVSNYYRYNKSHGQMWRTKPARVEAVLRGVKVTAFIVTDHGAGYSSPPTISVPVPGVTAVVKLKFGTDLMTNGSIESVTPSPAER